MSLIVLPRQIDTVHFEKSNTERTWLPDELSTKIESFLTVQESQLHNDFDMKSVQEFDKKTKDNS
jgi:hypothetical protein